MRKSSPEKGHPRCPFSFIILTIIISNVFYRQEQDGRLTRSDQIIKEVVMKLFFAVILGFVLLLPSSFAQTTVGPQPVGPELFLSQNYGWTIDFSKQEKKFFGFSWNFECSPKQVFPKEGINVFRYAACVQGDKSFHSVILWRLSSVKPVAIERMVYNAMSDGLGYGKAVCNEELVPSMVNPGGVIRDCALPLQHGTFFVSFYHFDIPMPKGGSFVNDEGKKEETLGFTIWVQNAGNVDPDVKKKIRELVSSIQMAKK